MQHLLTVTRSGTENTTLSPVSERHRLLLVNSGVVSLLAQQSYTLKAQHLFLWPAGLAAMHQGTFDGDVRVLEFCGNCLDLGPTHWLFAPFRLARFSEHKQVACLPDQRHWMNLLLDQMTLYQDESFASQYEVLRSQLLLILHEVSRLYPIEKARSRSQKIELALQYIEEHYRQPISLDTVARQIHWSGPYLANRMKAETGRSVGEWLQTLRLADAAARLIHDQASIAAIAASVGYADVTHFIRHFKRMHGQTPAAWRKAHLRRSGIASDRD